MRTHRRDAGQNDEDRVRELYERAAAEYGPALERLVRAYERDAARRPDVLQEIHIALWQSLRRFDGRCKLGTWVYRVAHNTAVSHSLRRSRRAPVLVGIEDVAVNAAERDPAERVDDERALQRLLALIHRLAPLDRQVTLLYLEDLDAAAIGDIVGLSRRSFSHWSRIRDSRIGRRSDRCWSRSGGR